MEFPQEQKALPAEQLTKKQEPLLELSGTVDEIHSIIKDLGGTNLSLEQQSRLRKIRGNIIKSTGRFSKVMRRVVAIGAIMGSVVLSAETLIAATESIGHAINNPALEEAIDASGQTIYTHPDELTTHFLNIIAGRDKFTEDDLKSIHENNWTAKDLNIMAGLDRFTDGDLEGLRRRYWKREFENFGLPLPANIEEISSLELATLFFEGPEQHLDPVNIELSAQTTNESITSGINEQAAFRSSKDLYDLVWKLEQESGNPRIRISSRHKSLASYSPSLNTVYVDVDGLISGYGIVAEMSHGKQFEDNLLGSSFQNARDNIENTFKSWFHLRSQYMEYSELYKKPGSLEYEAHKIIQPDLEKRYPLRPSNQSRDGESK